MSDTAMAIHPPAPARRRGFAWEQTLALLFDAYRDLQSRKLFWLTLFLSSIVPLLFAAVGIHPDGISIFGKHLRGVPFNSVLVPPPEFYRFLFTTLAVPIWLGLIATLLALMAVGGIFPDLISSGSIDLYLSRPLGRVRLFLTKYAFGLLFTATQVFTFCCVSFVVMGIRGGAWEAGIFLAVPFVTLFFSYLYCVCVLIGIVTRSTLAAILLTVLVWGGVYAVHNADMLLTQYAAAADARVDSVKRGISGFDELIARNQALPPAQQSNMTEFQRQRDMQTVTLAEYQQTADSVHWWRGLVYAVETPLPKTSETISLMSKWLVAPSMFDAIQNQERQHREFVQQRRIARSGPGSQTRANVGEFMGSDEANEKLEEELSARDLPWVLGTSLGFEAAVLALAAWIFCRKDF